MVGYYNRGYTVGVTPSVRIMMAFEDELESECERIVARVMIKLRRGNGYSESEADGECNNISEGADTDAAGSVGLDWSRPATSFRSVLTSMCTATTALVQ